MHEVRLSFSIVMSIPILHREAAMAEAEFILFVGWDGVRMIVMLILRPAEDLEF